MDIQSTVFIEPSMHPVDILYRAIHVASFLQDVTSSGSLNGDGANTGISEDGEQGLTVILEGLEGTIKMAIDRLTEDCFKNDTKK